VQQFLGHSRITTTERYMHAKARPEDLERVKTQLIAEAIYAQDNQATLARWYGGALATGLSIADIGAVELNDAFTTQSRACMRRLGLDPEIVNNDGGVIALGHPLGSCGSRIAITLLGPMEREGATRGLATMCAGVGRGTAMLIEAI